MSARSRTPADRTPVDRSVPPPPGDPRPYRFPPFLHRRLENGLDVFAARFGNVPLASLELVAPAGGDRDPEGRAGLATLTASLLDEGTERRSSLEIARRVEELGGYLSSGADWDVGYLATGLLSAHLDAGLELLGEVATLPTFPAAELDRLGRLRLAEIRRRRHEPGALADEQLNAAVFAGTVYGNSLLGDEESVAALTRDEVVAFYRRCYTAAGSAVIAVGDLDPERILAAVEAALGGMARGPAPARPAIEPPALSGVSVHVVDRPGASQTEVRLGHPGVDRRHPDYVPLAVMNTLLGGKFTSRINLNLRERHGYTYGASTRFVGRLGPGPFLAAAAVATENAGAAVREVLVELARIREEPVLPEELDETRQYLTGIFPYTLQTIDDLGKRLEVLAVYGLPDDYYDRYAERIAAVTREKILEVARRHLHPDGIAVVAVGPAETLEPQLEPLGRVHVHAAEREPQLAV